MTTKPVDRPAIGLSAGIVAAVVFAGMGLFINMSPARLPSSELLFFRGLLGALVFGVILRSSLIELASPRSRMVWARGVLGSASILTYYWNLRHASVGTATVLVDMAPVVLLVIAWIFLSRKPSALQSTAILITAVGAMLLHGSSTLGTLSGIVLYAGIGGATLAALAYMTLREATREYSSQSIVWAFSVVMMAAGVIAGTSSWIMPTGDLWWFVGGAAVCGLLGQYFLTVSFRHLPTFMATALSLTSALIGSAAESYLRGTWPDATTWLAYALILFGCWLVSFNK